MTDFASVDSIIAGAMAAWKPPPRLTLSEWADRYFYLSAESAAEPGRWKTIPYQREIMDAFTDPRVDQVSVMKSARVGWTKIVNALVGYCIHQTPCPVLVVQPTIEDAKGYSKEEIAPMLRDCPELARVVFEDQEETGPRGSGNTILHKRFPGGVLSLVGAVSGAGLRRVSRRVVLFDEVDGYPLSAGDDGDPVKLGIKRTEYYWDRKIGAGSTPLIAGASRIERLFLQGDQRRYFVPCPSCGHKAPLVFTEDAENAGHALKWPEGRPQEAFFACQKNGCVIEHRHKREMVEAGEWRAAAPLDGEGKPKRHVSFHIWAAYSYSPNATWGQLAEEFLEAKDDPQTLKTFVNTALGQTWKERGEAPDWERLYNRREDYPIGTVPSGVLVLTAGVDVQKDRFVYEVVGWGAGKESWSVDAGVIPADTASGQEWAKLDELLGRSYPGSTGVEYQVRCLAVDSGFQTQEAYNWTRGHALGRTIAVKGGDSTVVLLGTPKKVDVKQNGKVIARGAAVWPVGGALAKDELYGWLRLQRPENGAPFPPGWCHFPQYEEEFFRQLTAEHKVKHVDSKGFAVYQWQLQPGRENHWLDCRVYARAAAALVGLDRYPGAQPRPPAPAAKPPAASPGREPKPAGFLARARRDKGWL